MKLSPSVIAGIKYGYGSLGVPLLLVAHLVDKTGRWPTTADIPHLIAGSLIGWHCVHMTAQSG